MTKQEELLNQVKLAGFVGMSYSKEDFAEAQALILANPPAKDVAAFVQKKAADLWWVPASILVAGVAWLGTGSYLTRKRRRK